MRHYKYGHSSLEKITSTKLEMQELCFDAIRIANNRVAFCPDFGVSSGARTDKEQHELFKKGRDSKDNITDKSKVVTYADGFKLKSIHQNGLAIDIFAIKNGRVDYSTESLAVVLTCFYEAAVNLSLLIQCGINFYSLEDSPHIQIIKV